MFDWKTIVDDLAAKAGREVVILNNGRGVAFEDGFDVCWIIEGDALSTLPAPIEDTTTSATFASFERIDRVRRDVIHVLRHYLASKDIGISTAGSEWGIQTASGVSSSLSVGAFLTALARDGNGVEACLKALFQNSIVRHAPSAMRIARYLNTTGNPPNERGFEDKTITLGGGSMAGILKMMNLCRAAEAIPDEPTEDDGKRFAARLENVEATGPIGAALLRVGERLPHVEPSFDLMSNAITLRFPDALDSLSIQVKSRPFVRSVRDEGATVVGDRVADDFERLSRLRVVTLRAIDGASAQLGWVIEEAATGLFSGSTVWHVGRESRLLSIDVGSGLTDALRSKSPEQYLRGVASGSNEFLAIALNKLPADAAVEVASNPSISSAMRGRLAPIPPGTSPQLVSLDDPAMIADCDRWATSTLDSFKRIPEFWQHVDDPMYFDPTRDTWLTSVELIELARGVAEDSWMYPQAVRLLVEAGEPDADDLARRLVERTEFLYEAGDDLVMLAWQYRNAFPERSREHFAPRAFEDVPHAEARAKAGDPIAVRYLRAKVDRSEAEDSSTELELLPVSIRTLEPKARAIEWARREWRWSIVGGSLFEKASHEGWTEVADALNENPHLVSALLTHAARGIDGFDAPGILMADKLLLAWSKLKPTPLLARLILTARVSDIVGEAQESERAAARRNPKVKPADVDMAMQVMPIWWEKIQVPMAIAWRRWRDSNRDLRPEDRPHGR